MTKKEVGFVIIPLSSTNPTKMIHAGMFEKLTKTTDLPCNHFSKRWNPHVHLPLQFTVCSPFGTRHLRNAKRTFEESEPQNQVFIKWINSILEEHLSFVVHFYLVEWKCDFQRFIFTPQKLKSEMKRNNIFQLIVDHDSATIDGLSATWVRGKKLFR